MVSERLAVDFCGLRLQTPRVLLSGCVGFGDEYTRVEGFDHREVGAVVLQFQHRQEVGVVVLLVQQYNLLYLCIFLFLQ